MKHTETTYITINDGSYVALLELKPSERLSFGYAKLLVSFTSVGLSMTRLGIQSGLRLGVGRALDVRCIGPYVATHNSLQNVWWKDIWDVPTPNEQRLMSCLVLARSSLLKAHVERQEKQLVVWTKF